eukprot:2946027-Rhodomonas_salina.4
MSCWASGSGLKVWGFGVGSWGLGVWVCGNSGADQEGLTRELLRSAPTPTGCDPPARATQHRSYVAVHSSKATVSGRSAAGNSSAVTKKVHVQSTMDMEGQKLTDARVDDGGERGREDGRDGARGGAC